MTEKVTLRLSPEFAATFRDRAELANCFPAQRLVAMERLIEKRNLANALAEEIAQVRAEADDRHRDGSSKGGSVSRKGHP